MKQYLRFTLLLLLSFVLGGGYSLAQDETIVFSDQGYSNGKTLTSETTNGTNCKITYAKGSGNAPTYYNSGSAVRFYKGGSFTVSSDTKKITNIQITIGTYDKLSPNGNTGASSGTLDTSNAKLLAWSANDDSGVSSVTFTNTSTNKGYWAVSKVAVTYAADDGKTTTTTTITGITAGSTKTIAMYEEPSAAATVTAGETVISGAEVTYKSSNETVATVGTDGSVKTQAPGKATITASYAGDDTYSPSSASFTLVIKAAPESIMDMQNEIDKNPTEEIAADLTFKDIYVTGVNGKNAYISDGEHGMLIYTDGHGLTKGDVLNGTVENATLCLYKDGYEITNFSSEKLTITTTELTPAETTISSISKTNIGKYVTVKNLTYSSSAKTFTDADGNSIAYYDGLKTSVTLIDKNKYDVTGVVSYNTNLQLLPTEVTALNKEASLKTDADPQTALNIGATDTYTLTYDGDGTVSVESSATGVATAAYDTDTKTVTVTAVAKGTTTITISATEGEYCGIPTPVTYTLEVNDPTELTETFNVSDEDVKGKGESGAKGTGFTVERNDITIVTDDAYANASNGYIQIYGNSNITANAKEGYLVTGVTLTLYSTSSDKGTWKCNGESLSTTNGKTTWTGIIPSVTINNVAGSQAKLTSIKVDYIKLSETGKTVTIGETGKGTYCATENCIVGDGTVTKYITGTEENGTTLTEADAAVLADGEGVLLNGKAGTYKVYTHAKLAPTKNEDNKLVGCSADTSVPTGAYVMQNQDGNVAFYVVNASAPITCPAGKAYLTGLSSEAKALFFNDSEATGINATAADGEGAEQDIYTLSGVKVSKANLTKGIYIMNGKKFIVK